MTKQLYAVNKTASNLQLKRGFFSIDREGYKEVNDTDLEHPDFVDALNKDWIEITEERPADKPFQGGVVPIERATTYQGMTLEELQASNKADARDKKTMTTVTAIGKPAEPEAESVVEINEPTSEKNPKGKKTTKSTEKVEA